MKNILKFNNDDGSPIVTWEFDDSDLEMTKFSYWLDNWRCRFEHTNNEGIKKLVETANKKDGGNRSYEPSFRRPRYMIFYYDGSSFGLQLEGKKNGSLIGWGLSMKICGINQFEKPYIAWPFPGEDGYEEEEDKAVVANSKKRKNSSSSDDGSDNNDINDGSNNDNINDKPIDKKKK